MEKNLEGEILIKFLLNYVDDIINMKEYLS